jgi:hypothetical protein
VDRLGVFVDPFSSDAPVMWINEPRDESIAANGACLFGRDGVRSKSRRLGECRCSFNNYGPERDVLCTEKRLRSQRSSEDRTET